QKYLTRVYKATHETSWYISTGVLITMKPQLPKSKIWSLPESSLRSTAWKNLGLLLSTARRRQQPPSTCQTCSSAYESMPMQQSKSSMHEKRNKNSGTSKNGKASTKIVTNNSKSMK